jgi:chorismate synthase
MNTHGNLFRITTFWESHGIWLGVVIDGLPSGFLVDLENIQSEMDRRKPWQSNITTQRKEDAWFEVISWLYEWRSTWHPITIIVRNSDQDSSKYENIKDILRPNHADITYNNKYGFRDHRGWGRSSGRETVSRVIAGAIAKQYLKEKLGVEVIAYTKQVWNFIWKNFDKSYIEQNKLRVADRDIGAEMIEHVENIAKDGNSIWGVIECRVIHPPKNLWEPVFWKIKSILAGSMLSIWWVQWFEYGAWFSVVEHTWETYNEWFINEEWKIKSENNRYGWVLWGITTWEDIEFRVAIKPTASIYKQQTTVNKEWKSVDFTIEWRHDPCILPRVVPVIEAMAAIDMLDLYFMNQAKGNTI